MINLTPHALLFTVAAIGLSEAAYLVKNRRLGKQPICPIGEDCSTVLSSRYNHIFLGIHNDILGLLFYIFFLFATALLVLQLFDEFILERIMSVLLIGATGMSIYFTYVQAHILKAWCSWCVLSAITIGIMDIIMLTILLS